MGDILLKHFAVSFRFLFSFDEKCVTLFKYFFFASSGVIGTVLIRMSGTFNVTAVQQCFCCIVVEALCLGIGGGMGG